MLNMFVFLSGGAAAFRCCAPWLLIELLCVFAWGINIEETTQTPMWYYMPLQIETCRKSTVAVVMLVTLDRSSLYTLYDDQTHRRNVAPVSCKSRWFPLFADHRRRSLCPIRRRALRNDARRRLVADPCKDHGVKVVVRSWWREPAYGVCV